MKTARLSGWLSLVATFALVGTVHAATPTTRVKALPTYTTSSTITVSYDAQASSGTIATVDLYMSKDGAAFNKVATLYGSTQPFVVDTSAIGNGTYSFYTIGTVTGDAPEVKTAAEAVTTVDTISPSSPSYAKLAVNQVPKLDANEITGRAGTVEANATIQMYSDAALTNLLRSTTAKADGSFGPIDIGAPSLTPVYLIAVDAAGNKSTVTKVDNVPSYVGSLTQFSVVANGGTGLTVSFVAPATATQFRVQYRYAGGAVWSVDYFTVGQNGTTIQLTGLEAGRAYDVRVAPVDAQRNVGVWSARAARTTGAAVDKVVLAGEKAPVGVGGGTENPTTLVATTATTPSSTATTSTTPKSSSTTSSTSTSKVTTTTGNAASNTAANAATNTAANDAANTNANAATNTESTQNTATPWVILAILIVLAGIATGGYFYWFSGPEEVTSTVLPESDLKEEKKEEKDDDADKRW